jgi:phosphatidylglycerol:prolipoprotein diacylglycerol transferase
VSLALVAAPLRAASSQIVIVSPGVVWAAALVGALVCAVLCARRSGLDERAVYWAGVLGLFFGIWGGHLLGMVYYGTDGRPAYWLRFWSGGQAQYGGLIAGALAVAVFFEIRKLSFFPYADAIIPAVALGVAIGRVGCFLNGDDFGTLSHLPWAVRFPLGTEAYADHLSRGWIDSSSGFSLPVHPIQLYDSIFSFGLFAVLVLWRWRLPGLRLAVFAVGHGLGRFAEQFFRGDYKPILGILSLTQLISLLLVAGGVTVGLLAIGIEQNSSPGPRLIRNAPTMD